MQQFCFGLFLLLYLRYAQADVLAYQWSLLLGRSVEPAPWLVAIGLTLFASLLAFGLKHLIVKHHGNKSTAYALVAGVVALLTSIPLATITHQLVVALITLVMAVVFEVFIRRFKKTHPVIPSNIWAKNMPRAVEMLFVLLLLGLGNGVTDLQHYELQTAQALQSCKPKKAFKVGEKSYATSHRLFSMRCYLLATEHKKGLGDRIFEQMVPPGGAANLLLPTDNKQNLLFPSSNLYHLLGSTPQPKESALDYFKRCALHSDYHQTKHRNVAADYYLCALLLERRLPEFAVEVEKYYPQQLAQGKLPTYFAQALLLYTHTTPHTPFDYVDNNTEANYRDYMDMSQKTTDSKERASKLRESYGETYWWWFAYGEK